MVYRYSLFDDWATVGMLFRSVYVARTLVARPSIKAQNRALLWHLHRHRWTNVLIVFKFGSLFWWRTYRAALCRYGLVGISGAAGYRTSADVRGAAHAGGVHIAEACQGRSR